MFPHLLSALSNFPKTYVGSTGRAYHFKQLIRQRQHLGRVWLATNGDTKFILKDIPKLIFDHYNHEIQPNLPKCRHLRVPLDVIPEQRIFVFKYLDDNLLSLVQKGLSPRSAKQILKASLTGLAELHERDIVHLDIKPENIMLDYHDEPPHPKITKVQLTNLDNAAYLPHGRTLNNILAGNEDWRSPEASLENSIGKPTDIYAFGLVCIYAHLNHILLGEDHDFRNQVTAGTLPAMIRLQRAISYFGTQDSIAGLQQHLGDEKEQATNRKVLQTLWEGRHAADIPYKPFVEWEVGGDEVFRDFVGGLLDLDPGRRWSAEKALGHEWFGDVDESALF